MRTQRGFTSRALLVLALIVGLSRGALAQELDLLEGDDYLDPRYLRALKETRGINHILTGWFRLGGATGYQQRTEHLAFNGYVGTAAGEYYRSNFQMTVKGQMINDGWANWAPGLVRSRVAVARYLPKNDTADFHLDDVPRVRASYLIERRQRGRVDQGWAIDEDGKIPLPGLIAPATGGISVVGFPNRGETTFLFYALYPETAPSEWFEGGWGLQYGHTWFSGEHPGVQHNSLRLELYGVLKVATPNGSHHVRAVYSPVMFSGQKPRHGFMIIGSLAILTTRLY